MIVLPSTLRHRNCLCTLLYIASPIGEQRRENWLEHRSQCPIRVRLSPTMTQNCRGERGKGPLGRHRLPCDNNACPRCPMSQQQSISKFPGHSVPNHPSTTNTQPHLSKNYGTCPRCLKSSNARFLPYWSSSPSRAIIRAERQTNHPSSCIRVCRDRGLVPVRRDYMQTETNQQATGAAKPLHRSFIV